MKKLTAHQKKKIDAGELFVALQNLPETEKFKIFYMVKGIELKNEKMEVNYSNSNLISEGRELS